jgi:hypothetical protein
MQIISDNWYYLHIIRNEMENEYDIFVGIQCNKELLWGCERFLYILFVERLNLILNLLLDISGEMDE